jgi:hypothetical protein
MASELASGVDTAGFDWRLDSPWRRLPITLPGAVLVGLLGLWTGAALMPDQARPPLDSPDKLSLDAQLIEPSPPEIVEKSHREPPPRQEEPKPEPKPTREPPPAEIADLPASLEAPPAPSAEEWRLAAGYTLKNSKRYRNAWGQQVRSQMGTAVAGPDQGLVRFRITIRPDGSLAEVEELWSTSAKASELARKAIETMPPLPPTPTGKPLVFEKTISFLPYETGWPPSYKNDCLPDPPAFRNPFAWDGSSAPPTARTQATVDEAASEDGPTAECDPTSTASTIEEEEHELQRQIERNRWGR